MLSHQSRCHTLRLMLQVRSLDSSLESFYCGAYTYVCWWRSVSETQIAHGAFFLSSGTWKKRIKPDSRYFLNAPFGSVPKNPTGHVIWNLPFWYPHLLPLIAKLCHTRVDVHLLHRLTISTGKRQLHTHAGSTFVTASRVVSVSYVKMSFVSRAPWVKQSSGFKQSELSSTKVSKSLSRLELTRKAVVVFTLENHVCCVSWKGVGLQRCFRQRNRKSQRIYSLEITLAIGIKPASAIGTQVRFTGSSKTLAFGVD